MSGIVKNTSRRKHINKQSGGGLREDQLDEFINHIFINNKLRKIINKITNYRNKLNLILPKLTSKANLT